MVRRVVEEEVATPGTTVVEDDGSWIGRTVVTLVILALLVAGAVWLVRALSDNSTGTPNRIEQSNNPGTNDNNSPGVVPSAQSS